MKIEDAIGRDPERMSGALCFKGTRLPVKTLFDHLAYNEWDEFQEGFGPVTEETIRVILEAAFQSLDEKFALNSKAA